MGETVEARGLAGPQPVIVTRTAEKAGATVRVQAPKYGVNTESPLAPLIREALARWSAYQASPV